MGAIFVALIIIGLEGQKMRTYHTSMQPQLFESKVMCNKCGFTMDLEKTEYEEFMVDTIHSFKVGYGYASLHDEEFYQFDLCENCLEELYKTFKIPPKTTLGWDWDKDYGK